MTRQIAFFICLLSPFCSLAQSNVPQADHTPLVRHYKDGETLSYHMKASNQGRNQTIRYEADAKGVVKKDDSGDFIESFQWSGLSFNGQSVPLPANASNFRQTLSLDPAVSPSPPDFSRVIPMLIGPSADLLTFYADLWLVIKQGTLIHPGDHAYVKHGTPSSWADGTRTLIGQDSIDFDVKLLDVDTEAGTAKLVVRHVPPAQPQIKVPAKWLEVPVADAPNNWIEVTKTDSGKYLAEVGKETFDVEMNVSLADGRILSATMDNPVAVLARECVDETLTQCGEPEHYQIRRQIDLHLQAATGTIVLYRPRGKNFGLIHYSEGVRPTVYCDDVKIARIRESRKTTVVLNAGPHACVALERQYPGEPNADSEKILFQVKPGGITYLRLECPFGHVHFRLQEAGMDVGAKETAVLLAIKDKDSFTTTLSSKAPEQASR
jgi:hypothetical protein